MPASKPKLTPKFELLVEGSPVNIDVVERVVAISVRQDLEMADAVEVRVSNDDLRFTEQDTFAEGKKLAVKLGYVETETALVATGTIARRECEFPERGPAVLTVLAYDSEFKLKHGTHTRAWLDVKDSTVVSQLANDAGLTADVEDTSVTHKYLFQVAQTDLAYIRERAFRLGFVVSVDRENAKLSFKKAKTTQTAAVKLKAGEDLLDFRPRFTTSGQITKVEVRGWDMVKKKEVKGQATDSDLVSKMSCQVAGASRAKKTYGERTILLTPSATSADEATQIAKACLNQLLHTFAEGQGSAQGEHKIGPGTVVQVEGVGKRAGGNYYVVSALHHYEPRGYTTYFDFVRPGEMVSAPPPPKKAPPKPKPEEGPEEQAFETSVRHTS